MSKKRCDGCGGAIDERVLMRRLEGVLDEYEGKSGGLIPALQVAQKLFGYLPEAALKRISVRLKKPFSEVAGVVSFYSFFSTVPRGEHVVRVCLGTACYVRGGKQVLDSIKKHLGVDVGGTTPDRKFSLEVARCFGACGLAPAIMVDDDIYQRVKAARVQDLLMPYARGKGSAKKGARK